MNAKSLSPRRAASRQRKGVISNLHTQCVKNELAFTCWQFLYQRTIEIIATGIGHLQFHDVNHNKNLHHFKIQVEVF